MLSNLQRISNHRLFRAGSQMVVWRFGALVLSAAGNIWTARCLGPGKLGISGFILTGVGQATLLVTLPPSSYLVRRYKESDSPDGCLKLVETGTSVRAIFSLIAIVFAALRILVI